ncbi:MAG: polysaccharide deacetylase family protein [Rhizobiaceae bacterium]|nr:polysaccharide deacetylase family protein [Rhizobiaceae bacterium]
MIGLFFGLTTDLYSTLTLHWYWLLKHREFYDEQSGLFAAKRTIKKTAIQTGLELFSAASATGIFPNARGLGSVFTLHRVEPYQYSRFDPNAHLSVTPDFLEKAIIELKSKNYKAIPLDALPDHLNSPDPQQPVMVFTLDDGYRNNFEYALPVFKKHNIPFTVFACSGFVNRQHSIWWETITELAIKLKHLKFDLGNGPRSIEAANLAEKYNLFCWLAHDIMMLDQNDVISRVDEIARENGVHPTDITNRLIMDEAQLKQLSREPLAQIGAHTVSHPNLALLSDEQLKIELDQSRRDIEAMTSVRPTNIAFPYGKLENAGEREFNAAKDLGFDLAVSTEPDVLKPDVKDNLHSIQRISLNGYYQSNRYVGALASGLPFKFFTRMTNKFQDLLR